ncbi:3231_t:CDS:2 [Scutellospora calospora]|uniref:3231_t:CDS:1 n=1 Tax=Scutellospora calospora TaxID=85575 RepID=A0ACA9L4I3_9GLOM|nr:3231_t:CDS:2 [Scutellospora calospora]
MRVKKEESKILYKEDRIPDCDLCDIKYFRCKAKKCTQCCKLNKYILYPCENCKNKNIECEYSIIKSEEEFNRFERLGLSAYIGQIEQTKTGKTHVQAYCQFKKKTSIDKLGKMFNNYTLSFPDKMKGNVNSNIEYASKLYNRCDRHKKRECKCDYENLNKQCRVCNTKCLVRSKSRIDGLNIGPFKFGNFCELENEEELEIEDMDNVELIREKNGIMLDDMRQLKRIRDEQISHEDVIMNSEYQLFWRPIVFYLYGPGGSRKTGLVNELFEDEFYEIAEKNRGGAT